MSQAAPEPPRFTSDGAQFRPCRHGRHRHRPELRGGLLWVRFPDGPQRASRCSRRPGSRPSCRLVRPAGSSPSRRPFATKWGTVFTVTSEQRATAASPAAPASASASAASPVRHMQRREHLRLHAGDDRHLHQRQVDVQPAALQLRDAADQGHHELHAQQRASTAPRPDQRLRRRQQPELGRPDRRRQGRRPHLREHGRAIKLRLNPRNIQVTGRANCGTSAAAAPADGIQNRAARTSRSWTSRSATTPTACRRARAPAGSRSGPEARRCPSSAASSSAATTPSTPPRPRAPRADRRPVPLRPDQRQRPRVQRHQPLPALHRTGQHRQQRRRRLRAVAQRPLADPRLTRSSRQATRAGEGSVRAGTSPREHDPPRGLLPWRTHEALVTASTRPERADTHDRLPSSDNDTAAARPGMRGCPVAALSRNVRVQADHRHEQAERAARHQRPRSDQGSRGRRPDLRLPGQRQAPGRPRQRCARRRSRPRPDRGRPRQRPDQLPRRCARLGCVWGRPRHGSQGQVRPRAPRLRAGRGTSRLLPRIRLLRLRLRTRERT